MVIEDGVCKYVNQAISEIDGYSIYETMDWGPEEVAKVICPEGRLWLLERMRGRSKTIHARRHQSIKIRTGDNAYG